MKDILIMAIIMAVPVTAILSNAFLKYKKLALQQPKDPSDTAKLTEQLMQMTRALEEENTRLRQRIENLETIIALGESLHPELKREQSQHPPLPPDKSR